MNTGLILVLIGMLGVSAGKRDKCKLCRDIYEEKGRAKDGVYTLRLWDSVARKKLKVKAYCDMTNGGYTVFQRRLDGSVSFAEDWDTYKSGFGSKKGNFWLGNDNIYLLTSNCGPQSIRVGMETCNGTKGEKIYSSFQIGDESTSYKASVSGGLGSVNDVFTNVVGINGMRFSTHDVHNDRHYVSCSLHFGRGGWWFNACFLANPNGPLDATCMNSAKYMAWQNWPHSGWNGLRRMSLGVIDADVIATIRSAVCDPPGR